MIRLLTLLLLVFSGGAHALESVTLQLKWRHQFQFAGYYAALDKGFYRDAGLQVTLLEATAATNVVEEVVSGRAQYGVGTSELVLAQRKAPVVALAVIFQHSPLILLAREDTIGNLHELAGQKVMIEAHAEELFAYLRQEGVAPESLQLLPHRQGIEDLISGKIAAMSAYSTTEPYLLRRARIRTMEFSPRAVGIDFYGDNLFTSAQELRLYPERAKAFRAATLRGWEYAMKHPEEIIALILARYNSQGLDRNMLAFEANRTAQLMQADLVEMGYMNPGRWQHIADVYADLGLMPRSKLPEGFLYSNVERHLPAWLTPTAAMAGLVILLLSLLVYRNVHLSRRLKREFAVSEEANRQLAQKLTEVQELQSRLKEQAIRDGLTGLFNRRYLDETLPRELARAKRQGYPLAVIMLDVDHFKKINDTYGHPGGDELLKSLGAVFRDGAREGDISCRYGGEEFVIVLPHMGIDAALMRAEKWRKEVEATQVKHDDFSMRFTISAGVSGYPDHANDHEGLIQGADRALYAAKGAGRNCVACFVPDANSRPA
ncbi:MAG TPA: diguanylate cyclase [Burkholderiaceae bacterium]|nr:diguanylate cyclase [Burkholderiaceae bacterium]